MYDDEIKTEDKPEDVDKEHSNSEYFYDAYREANPIYEKPQEEPKPKKERVFLKKLGKAFKLTVAALFLGCIAGAGFYGINYMADEVFDTDIMEAPSQAIVVNKAENVATNSDVVMDVSQIVENSMTSMVSITGSVVSQINYGFFLPQSYESPISGSGIVIGQNDNQLFIVTNAHVVENVNNLTVTFIDGKSASATVKGLKSNKDIAVISVNMKDMEPSTLQAISIVPIGDSGALKMGQPVVAIGNALGEGQSSTVGWISALNRTIVIDNTTYENLIMTDAAINPGNSGGALLNMQGQLIGINSAKYSDEQVEGMGYAIPISSVADIINDLITKEVREKVDADKIGYLGISGMNITSDINKAYGWPVGAAITKIGDNSPANVAGLLKNDIIVGFDGEDIETFEQLRELMEYYSEGESIKVDFYRLENGEYVEKSCQVTLGRRSKYE